MKEKERSKEVSRKIGKNLNIQPNPPSPPFDKPKMDVREIRDSYDIKIKNKDDKKND